MRRAAAVAMLLVLGASALHGQQPGDSTRAGWLSSLPVRFTGDVNSTGELYGASGTEARRPGQSWRASVNSQLTFFGSFSVGLNILLSNEGSQLRQNVSQFGLNPRWRWATFHVGDFSQNYSTYTVQGARLRGAGVDLRPGILRFSVQSGTAQRTVASGGAGNLAYKRTLTAALIGVGREQSPFVDLLVVRAKDDPGSLQVALADTLLLDTIPVALRPRYDVRPQQNLVLGTQGQATLFSQRLVVREEAAIGVITRDQESPAATPSGVTGGSALGGLIPVTLSTSRDYALRLDGSYSAGPGSVTAGYEYVGPGFTSLGLAYVINDRRAYRMGGTLRLLAGRVNLQGQLEHQNDNLANQKSYTTARNSLLLSVSGMVTQTVTAALTVMHSGIANGAAVDTFVVDNRSLAMTANAAAQTTLFGMRSSVSLAYAFQQTSDGNVITRIPQVTVHNVSASVQLGISRSFSLAPSLSVAATRTEGAASQENVFLGLRAQGRIGALRPSAALSRSFSSGRAVTSLTGQVGWTLPWEARVSLQGRHVRYGALGSRPAFTESFLTMSVSRGF
jgi:hypothetical protein